MKSLFPIIKRLLPALLIGGAIIAAFIASFLERGFYTWVFNSIAYLPLGFGLAFTVFCLLVLFLFTFLYDRLELLRPSGPARVLYFGLIFLVFFALIFSAAPIFPNQYGDGRVAQPGHFRLRYDLLNTLVDYLEPWLLGRPYYHFHSLDFAMPPVSIFFGFIYLLIALVLVLKTGTSFFQQLTGLLYFAFIPPVVNFTGHWDSYSIFVAFACASLGFAYIALEKRSAVFAAAALAALVLAVWEKYLGAVMVIYPLGWLFFAGLEKKGIKGGRLNLCSAVFVFVILLASLYFIRNRTPLHGPGDFGAVFKTRLESAGWWRAVYDPFHYFRVS